MAKSAKKKWVAKLEEKDMGFEPIAICRPRFIFFDFDGLKPNTAYWVFFNSREVTNWCNTSYTLSDYLTAPKNSLLRDPGEKFKNETGFPQKFGGPTGTPLYSDSTGSLEGAFFLQSNSAISFPTGKLQLAVLDISVSKPANAHSMASVMYKATGTSDLFTMEDNGHWVKPKTPKPKKPTTGTSVGTSNSGGGGVSGSKSSSKDKSNKKSTVVAPTSSGVDLPGNVFSRALGIGVGGAYMKNTSAETKKKDKAGSGPNSNSGDGACFITTAMVERRGEADDGVTLSKLRLFRDTFMSSTAGMEEDVKEYYDIAPKIVAAIPDDHSDWQFIEEMIDQSCMLIDSDKYEEAYECYKTMVNTLKTNWIK